MKNFLISFPIGAKFGMSFALAVMGTLELSTAWEVLSLEVNKITFTH
jgi:hypothetical protein